MDSYFPLQVIAGGEVETAEGEVVLPVVNVGQNNEESHVDEDIAATWLGEARDESSAGESLDEDEEEGREAVVDKVISAPGEEFRLDEAQGFEEAESSGQSREMGLELDEDVGEGVVDEELGEAERGEGGAEGGQERGSSFKEVVNLTQGEGRNVGKDAVTGESVDESNADQSNVEDAEVQAAGMEKVSYISSFF